MSDFQALCICIAFMFCSSMVMICICAKYGANFGDEFDDNKKEGK